MHRTTRPFVIIFLASIFLVIPTIAFADAMIMYLDFGERAPGIVAAVVGVWLLAVIVLLEAVVLMAGLKIRFLTGLWVSFCMNLVSMVAGYLVTIPEIGHGDTFLSIRQGYAGEQIPVYISLAVVLALVAFYRRRMPWWFSTTALVSMLAPLVVMVTLGLYAFGFVFTMLLAFGLSLVIEGATASSGLKRNDVWKSVLAANVLSYLLIAVLAATHVADIERGRLRGIYVWETEAKATLRSVGSSEIAYHSENRQGKWGTFSELKESGDIASGFTQGNMVYAYSLDWRVNNLSVVQSEEYPKGIGTFTVIAWPSIKDVDLRTFVITEDQKVRVYNPKHHDKLDSPKSWDPIL